MSYLAEHMNVFSPLFISNYSPAAVLSVKGEDALAFLQGQFTQELRSPEGLFCAYGLWLNQKGKVLADSYVLRNDRSWWLVSFTSPAPVIRERLEAYIIADDVLLEDVTESWDGTVVGGQGASSWLESQGVVPPPQDRCAEINSSLIFPGRRGFGRSWEWLSLKNSEGKEFGSRAGVAVYEAAVVERQRIRAGIPAVPGDIGPGDLPNEGGLEREAISYTKGCYLGQEVMARLKSMGQVRRQLLKVRGPGAAPARLTALYLAGKKIGEIRSAIAEEAENTFIGLAMVSLLGLGSARLVSLEINGEPTIEVLQNLS